MTDLDPNCLTLVVFLGDCFYSKDDKNMKKRCQVCKELKNSHYFVNINLFVLNQILLYWVRGSALTRVCSTHLEPLLKTSNWSNWRNAWSSLGARGDRSSLCIFHKIYCGAVSIEKKSTWPLLTVKKIPGQYCRFQTYSDALDIDIDIEDLFWVEYTYYK